MRSVWAVTYANLRGGKSQAASLLLFVFIATVFLSLGVLLLGQGEVYDSRIEATHAPHAAIAETSALYTPEQESFLASYPGVTEIEKVPAFLLVGTDIKYGNNHIPRNFVILDAAYGAKMNGLTVMEGSAPRADNEICVPYILKAGGGYHLGDTLTMTSLGSTLSYTISCFTEDLMFGPAIIQVLQVYVAPPEYARIAEQHPEWAGFVIRARMDNPSDADRLSVLFSQKFFVGRATDPDSWWYGMTYYASKLSTIFLATMIAALLMVFAVILVIVSLLVIRFTIRNSIEENMTNTGVLKALGYNDRQLMLAMMLQFGSVGAVGIVAATGVAYLLIPLVWGVLEAMTALRWHPRFDAASSLGVVAAVCLALAVVTWLSSRGIRTLTPISALRQGMGPHSFKRNYFPLERSRGPLPWLLAMKYGMQARRQALTMFIIIAVVGFAVGVGASTYQNLTVDPDAFTRLFMGEPADVQVTATTGETARDVRAFVSALPNVHKALLHDSQWAVADDLLITPEIVEDLSQYDWLPLYEGRYPKHDNEITISGLMSTGIGKGVGESVRITMFGHSADFLIVGIIQDTERQCRLTVAGVQRLDPGYEPRSVYVYLNDSTKTTDLIDAVNEHFGPDTVTCIDKRQKWNADLGVYRGLAQGVSFAILAVTLLVILLSVWLVMKTMILRRRHEFGIQKTLGFTTGQLMNQLALHLVPIITAGIVTGAILGGLCFNPLFSVLTRNLGIIATSMPLPYGLTLATCGAQILVSYLFSMLVAWRLRKVSVIALVTE